MKALPEDELGKIDDDDNKYAKECMFNGIAGTAIAANIGNSISREDKVIYMTQHDISVTSDFWRI